MEPETNASATPQATPTPTQTASPAPDAQADAIKALQQQIATLTAAFEQSRTTTGDGAPATPPQGVQPPVNERTVKGGFEAPYIAQFEEVGKYDNLSATDVAFLVNVMDAGKSLSQTWAYRREHAVKALAVRIADDVERGKSDHSHAVQAMKALRLPVSTAALKAIKAIKLNHSTQSGFGDEWIGVAYSSDLWRRVVDASPVLPRVPTIEVPQGSESIVIPIESTPPTFYKVAQATAQDANPGPVTRTHTTSKLATANTTLSVAKLGAATYWSGEMEEDSVVPFLPTLRRSMEEEHMNVMEALVIDGDTATGATTNINDIAGTPGGTESFLVFNGFRKLALVTNTANSRSAGALTPEDYLETVKLLGAAGRLAVDMTQVGFVVDLNTYWKSLELPEVKTRDVNSAATVESGRLTRMYGYDVITTANMHRAQTNRLANTDGKIDLDTGGNNTTGSILAVYWRHWLLGYKRRIRFETIRVPSADATEIVANSRVGMVYRDTDASAISYNVTV